MHPFTHLALAAAALTAASCASAQITFYENDGFQGRNFSTTRGVDDFTREGFNDRASSIVIESDRWQVCQDVGFAGRCVELHAGRYPSLSAIGLNDRISSVRYMGAEARPNSNPQPGAGQITFYEDGGFKGRSFSTTRSQDNFKNQGFNDRASSIVVEQGVWQACDDIRYAGRCVELRPGRYPSLATMGLTDRISSVRYIGAAQPVAAGADYRRRDNERLYEANVTSVHAVMATPERKCWVEREQVAPEHTDNRIPGALVGALLGGVLGHQVGGGMGNSLATVGGAVAGGAVGAHLGSQSGEQTSGSTRDVERCSTAQASNRPDYWDVTYSFRGTEHRMQTTSAPGPTVTVNRQGEPRT